MQGEVLSCQDSNDLRRQLVLDPLQQAILCAFLALLLLALAGALVERYLWPATRRRLAHGRPIRPELRLLLELFACFSLRRNWRIFTQSTGCCGALAADSCDNMIATTNLRSPGSASQAPSMNCAATGSTGLAGLLQVGPTPGGCLARNETQLTFASGSEASASLATPSASQRMMMSQPTRGLSQQLTVKIAPDEQELASSSSADRRGPSGSSLSHLSGLRLLVIIWVTVGHSFLYPSANNYQYYRSIIKMNVTRDSVWFATTNFTLGIDMLLYMTGLVFVYKLANGSRGERRGPESGGAFWLVDLDLGQILRFLSRKMLRFWPTYLALVGLAIVTPLLSDGPMWPEMVLRRIGQACRQNWWANLLMVNNFLSESQICLPSSWFVSVLMQLFLVGSIVMVLIRRLPLGPALTLLALLTLGASSISFALAYYINIRAPVIKMDESFMMELDDTIFRLYTNIFNNLGPFLVGMAGGLLLVNRNRQIAREQRAAATPKKSGRGQKLWELLGATSLCLIVSTIAALVLSSVFHQHYSRPWAALYWALHRVGWALVTGYLVHQCATGRWKLLHDLLALSTFIPLSRLIFIAYLIHPILIHLHSGLVRDGLHVSIYNMANIYITRLVMTFALALLVHLLVELPFCSFEAILLRKWARRAAARDEGKLDESSRSHPLLAVAPVVTLQLDSEVASKARVDENPSEPTKATEPGGD